MIATNTAFTLLIALPLAAAPLIYLIGRLVYRAGKARVNPAGWLTLAALLVTAGLWVVTYLRAQAEPLILISGQVTLAGDAVFLLMSATAIALGLMVTLFSIVYMRGEPGEEKFYALLSANIGSIIGLAATTDLFNLWVWFEAMAVTTYLLVAFYKDLPGSLESGIKYLVQSAAGSALILIGIALVVAEAGTLELNLMIEMLSGPTPLLLAAGGLMIVGFGVKTALVPMHTWLPDAHSQAPSGISMMLSGIVIEAGMIAMLRVLAVFYNVTDLFGPLLLGFAALNILVGNLMALRQTEVKRMLAYSSVAQVGYILLGFGTTFTFGAKDGAISAFFHLMNHALMKGLAFMAAGVFIYVFFLSKGSHGSLKVSDLNGAARKYPLAALTFSIAVLALGGLPPLSGFMSKTAVFLTAFITRDPWMIARVIFAALNAVLSLAYYAPLVNRMYRLETSEAVKGGGHMPWLMGIPLIVMALLIVVMGFYPMLLSDLFIPAGVNILPFTGF